MELVVTTHPDSCEAEAALGGQTYGAVVGRHGPVCADAKREGDGKTPLGVWKVLYGMYRADRVAKPKGTLEWRVITHDMGWCDASGDPRYNKPCPADYEASHELLWREDEAYDYILVLDYNVPVRHGRGSAIFVHVWREGATCTAGCVALKLADLKAVLPQVTAVRVE